MISMAFSIPVGATDVYKWVDDEGKTHYSEKPLHEDANKMEILQSTGKSRSARQNNHDRDKLLQVMEEERQAKKEEKRQAEETKLVQAEKCEKIEKRLAGLLGGGVFYSKNKEGERIYLTEEEVTAEINRLEKARNSLCHK